MKTFFRSLCAPLLSIFESGTEDYAYKPLNRLILRIVGFLFSVLVAAVIYLSPPDQLGILIPITVFGVISLVCLIIGFLGNDRAVSKIWGNK